MTFFKFDFPKHTKSHFLDGQYKKNTGHPKKNVLEVHPEIRFMPSKL